MPTDRELLIAAGEALFGSRWKSELAPRLRVHDRSIRRWLQSGCIPPGVWQELAALLEARCAAMELLLEQLIHRVARAD